MNKAWIPRIGAIVLLAIGLSGCGSTGGPRKASRLERRASATFGKLAHVEQAIELPANPQILEIEHASRKWQAAIEVEYEKASKMRDELRAQKSGSLRFAQLVGKAIGDGGLTESILLLAEPILGEKFLVDATNQQGGKLSNWLEWRIARDHEFGTRYTMLKAWANSRSSTGRQ